jgi:acetyltransferase
MLDIVEVFVSCGLPRGNAVGLITMSGGAGVLMADRAEEMGLSVPLLGVETQQALKTVLPDYAAFANPVDVTGQFLVNPPILRASILITLADPRVDVGIVWLQLMESHVDVLCEIFGEVKAKAEKPFVVCWVAAPEAGIVKLRQKGIAVLRGAEPAVHAVAALVQYAEMRRR